MPHLPTFRVGWENERLASYLLSRFSFVAHPSSVGDDLGSDFFCTIFEVQAPSGIDELIPRSSFAIQVKSSGSQVSVDNKIDYLMRLEMPYFVGVVNQSPARMDVYSAEFLPVLFADVGRPDSLVLALISTPDFDRNNYYNRLESPLRILMRCPLVATLNVDDKRQELTEKVSALLRICGRTRENIASRVSEEHIYKTDDCGLLRIIAGPGSALHFRMNFLKRLGEVFYNLHFILGDAPPDSSLLAEIEAYDSLYQRLRTLDGYGSVLPLFVSVPHQLLQQKLQHWKSATGS
jgi:hypothetical protein